jgi:hypothetical protein
MKIQIRGTNGVCRTVQTDEPFKQSGNDVRGTAVMIRWIALLLAVGVFGAPTIGVTEPARICKAVCKKAAAGSRMTEKERRQWDKCICDEVESGPLIDENKPLRRRQQG